MRLVNIPSPFWRQEILRILSPHDAAKHVYDVISAAMPNDDGSFSVKLSVEACDVATPTLAAAGGLIGNTCATFFMERPGEDESADFRWSP